MVTDQYADSDKENYLNILPRIRVFFVNERTNFGRDCCGRRDRSEELRRASATGQYAENRLRLRFFLWHGHVV